MKMKKIKVILSVLALGAIAASASAFAACGNGEEHTHSYTEWKYNDEQHWKICAEDGAEGPKSDHKFVDGKCECGYEQEASSGLLSPVGDTDWYEYDGEDFSAEDWAAKEIAYQFTGTATVGAGADSGSGINYPTVMDLYTDGSVRILHGISAVDGSYAYISDLYYGLWENNEDTLSVSINFVYASGLTGAKEYMDRNIYADGLAFTDGKMDVSLPLDVYAAMNYTQAHDLSCDNTIVYESRDDFANSLLLSPATDIDWYEYEGEDYGNEDWASKKIAYQFTGTTSVGAGADSGSGVNYPTVMNLYTDGSVRILHASAAADGSYAFVSDIYYGLWENNEGSLSISINFVYASDVEQNKVYMERNLYTDGLAFTDGKIDISLALDVYAAMNYTQTHELSCDGSVKYATDADFEASLANK